MMKNYLLIGIILSGLFVGCTTKKDNPAKIATHKTLGRVIIDSIAPPEVIMLTGANAPQVIKAAPPVIEPLSHPSGVGVPNFTNYNVADGLSQNNVFSSAIDHQGNIWFATLSGISKFDGTSFTNYNTGNGLISDFTSKIFIDSRNTIWISTVYGLSIFDGKSFTNPVVDKNIPKDRIGINNFLEDNNGTIWLSSFHGLYKYEHGKFNKFTIADRLADSTTMQMIKDKKGNILIYTRKGITRYDGKSFTPYTNLPLGKDGTIPYLLCCDSKGNIWFRDSQDGLGKYDGNQIKFYTKKDGYNGGGIFLEDKAGNFWIAGNGLTWFDGNRFINYSVKEGMASDRIRSLTEDEQGNIWITTQNNGVSKLNNSYLTSLEITGKKGFGQFAIDRFGNKWVSGFNGLGKYSTDHITWYGKELLSSDIYIGSPNSDHEGNIWFILYSFKNRVGKLVKFDGTNFTIFGKDQGLSFSPQQFFFEDNSNNIWLTGVGFGGVKKWGVTKFDGYSFTKYGSAQGLQSSFGFYSVFQDKKNCFWFGSGDAGVYKFDGSQFTVYDTRDGLPHNFVNDITEDSLGNLWFATDGGAAKFDGKSFTAYRSGNGLDNTIAYVEYDSVSKSIWFSTGIGLASVKLEQVAEETPFFQHYNPRTGFKFSSSIIDNMMVDKEGVVWGGYFNDISRFDYKTIREFRPLSVQIKNIRLNNKNIIWNSVRTGAYPTTEKDSLTAINEMVLKFGKAFSEKDFSSMTNAFGKISFDSVAGSDFIPVNLVLPIKNNNISFEFGSISPSFGKAVLYQYKLEGYDKNWSELSNKTEASFGNMSEGHYTFYVKALSPFGSWSETSYSFKVLPPWWRTWWAYTSYVLLLGIAVITFIRWRTKALQKEKIVLEEKVTKRTTELNQSLENLKSTQSQLIQSEKMASLGELTAGIAHEIQNPLNFVNNFSEVNSELIEEQKEELEKGNITEAKNLANEIAENEKKIVHHGKRADAIVKGMLQHSRSSSGQKEPTDINALCDEYLRLSYHGLRAKDKSFNATMKTDFDPSIGNIYIVPQDIGRVVLNLINNAFYAVDEKKKSPHPLKESKEDSSFIYEPLVTVTTKRLDPPLGDRGKIEIKVSDNGGGIPQKVLDKIFQPFFTTKPTGQGTGLGLSLSYDIVKAHGGEIKVETKENVGTEFIIQLPIN
jgi:signal transduction histidine kinase/ligand-binding sensor domain-containing protein